MSLQLIQDGKVKLLVFLFLKRYENNWKNNIAVWKILKIQNQPKPDFARIERGYNRISLIEKGKLKARAAKELLNEL